MRRPSDVPLLNRAAFDTFVELFEPDELREVIGEWHVDATSALAAIEAALEAGDGARIGQIAHRAAGGGLALGASNFAAACEALRAAAEAGPGARPADVAVLRETIASTHRAMLDAARTGG